MTSRAVTGGTLAGTREEKGGNRKKKGGEGKKKAEEGREESIFKGVGEGFNNVMC